MWILFLRKHPENHQKLDKYLLDFFVNNNLVMMVLRGKD